MCLHVCYEANQVCVQDYSYHSLLDIITHYLDQVSAARCSKDARDKHMLAMRRVS